MTNDGMILVSASKEMNVHTSPRPSTRSTALAFRVVSGKPDVELITTSHVEKQNHTLRMHCRRFTRLTNAFSKKLENFEAAIALNFAYYNFCKTHGAL
jgi:IS1 family transposase